VTADLPPCDRCHRPAKRQALYYRTRNGAVLLAGRYGRKCFYFAAGVLAASGAQVEHEDARIIHVRTRRP
jgi:hypothetical protein